MHPTRTTTTLLLGVACAVSAASGCVNVSPGPAHPAAAPSSGAPPQHEPRGGPGSLPVVVRAPALEALEAAPERPARQTPSAPAAPVSGHTPRGAAGRPAEAAPRVPEAAGAAEPSGRTVEHRGGRPHRPRSDAEAPRELMRQLPVRPADVCALGRRHGRWHPDSPEARICAGVRDG
ncbi:hypothetical protein ACLF6K_34620 [Streptomyces xanthophaeus]|uniref:hypothetical protein n=1 Tax=Streptomyces xanthophaeus TaxID=67385 RepID=UPI00398FDA46